MLGIVFAADRHSSVGVGVDLGDRTVALFLLGDRRHDIEGFDPSEKQIQRPAVGDDHDGFVVSGVGDERRGRVDDAVALLDETFATLRACVCGRVPNLGEGKLGIAEKQFAVGESLENAKIPLSPATIRRRFTADGSTQWPSGLYGSPEIGAQQAIDRIPVGDGVGERPGLALSSLAEPNRCPPLYPTLTVPWRLAVSHEHQCRHTDCPGGRVVTFPTQPHRHVCMSEPVEVTVYRRENCHLCESALETIERVADDSEVAVSITEIDVDTDESLAAAYGDRVPHILIDGADAFSYRVHAAAFRTELRAAADSVGSSATE